MTAPRLHVLTATSADTALILRRGPTDHVASCLWHRATGEVTLGQWLIGRIHEHRTDLSPDGRHLIYFATKAGQPFTGISRAPWLTALVFLPQDSTWHGGGAFTETGEVFFNGGEPPDRLPDGLMPAPLDALPHGTDGFHMGDLYAAQMIRRGWRHVSGVGTDAVLLRDAPHGWRLELTFAVGADNRSMIANRYALIRADGLRVPRPEWEWADLWSDGLQVAARGAIWDVALPDGHAMGDETMIHDLADMTFERRTAPYGDGT